VADVAHDDALFLLQCVGTLLLIFENPPQRAALNANASAEGFVRSVKGGVSEPRDSLKIIWRRSTVGHATSGVPSAPNTDGTPFVRAAIIVVSQVHGESGGLK